MVACYQQHCAVSGWRHIVSDCLCTMCLRMLRQRCAYKVSDREPLQQQRPVYLESAIQKRQPCLRAALGKAALQHIPYKGVQVIHAADMAEIELEQAL